MGELKGYGLTDYLGGTTYKDFLEPGENALFVSDRAEYVAYVYSSTNMIGNANINKEGQLIVTNLRAFILGEKVESLFKKYQWPVHNYVYDYEYIKKLIKYDADYKKRVAAAGAGMAKAMAEEMKHRDNLDGMNVLIKVRNEKSLLGDESLVMKFEGVPIGKSMAAGVMKALTLGMSKGRVQIETHIKIKKPLAPVSDEAGKYAKDPKYPNTGQASAYMSEKVEDVLKNMDDIRSMAEKAGEE